MTKKELIDVIANETELTKKDILLCLDTFADIIISENAKGEMVDFSNLGRFLVLKKKASQARNPKTGEIIQVKEHYVPKFKPKASYKLTVKEALNK